MTQAWRVRDMRGDVSLEKKMGERREIYVGDLYRKSSTKEKQVSFVLWDTLLVGRKQGLSWAVSRCGSC